MKLRRRLCLVLGVVAVGLAIVAIVNVGGVLGAVMAIVDLGCGVVLLLCWVILRRVRRTP